jgi:imidazolonepropionase-like amidohydrolase
MPASLAVRGAVLIDGTGRSPVPDSVVVIDAGKFAAVGSGQEVQIPNNAEIIDATGSFVLPGLMNGNVHLLDGIMMMGTGGIEYLARHEGAYHHVIEEAAQVALRSGMTTVFDTWNALEPVLVARDRINNGTAEGARIFCAGNIVGFGGPFSADFHLAARQVISPSFANRIDTLFEAGVGHQLSLLPATSVRSIVRDYLQRGVDMLKIAVSDHVMLTVGIDRGYLTFPEKTLRLIAEEARAAGVPILTHTMSLNALDMALDIDADILIHATMTGQQSIPAEVVDRINEQNTWCEIQSVTDEYQGHLERSADPWAVYGGYVHAENERLLVRSQAQILLGTDAGCTSHDVLTDIGKTASADRPFTLGQDHGLWMKAMVQKGMSPMQAILAGTRNVAAAYGQLDALGTIEVGKTADLVLLGADPLTDITNMGTLHTVIKDGRIIDRTKLPVERYVTTP